MEIILSSEPSNCIYCGGDDLVAGAIRTDAFTREVYCLDCALYWEEIFNFDSIQVPEEHVHLLIGQEKGL